MANRRRRQSALARRKEVWEQSGSDWEVRCIWAGMIDSSRVYLLGDGPRGRRERERERERED